MRTSEDEIRRTLRDHADRFDMPPEAPRPFAGEIRRRRSRNGLLAGVGAAALVAVATASIVLSGLGLSGLGPPDAPSQVAVADHGSHVNYVLFSAASTGDRTQAPAWLTDHIACMRAQGFDIPDPTRTADGWSVDVRDPAAIGFGTPAWREAAFVTCPLDRPMSGNLILGLPKDRVDAFVTCMA